MTAKTDVATLVAQMNEALASIHATIEGLSNSAAESDTKLDELEKKRDNTIAELQAAYEKEQAELAAARQKELEEIAEQRRKEDEEREARRRREDEELAARKAKEDEEKLHTFDTTTHNVEDEMDGLMDDIEDATAKVIAEGEAKLAELEKKRAELNRLIEEQMKASVPPVPTRKRARTVRRGGGTISGQPSPLPKEETAEKAAESPAESAPSAPPAEGTPAAEDKDTQEGDDSQPPNEEPVAEKSLEAVSTEEAQSSEDTPATEVAAPEAQESCKDDSVPEQPEEAAAPEEASEPAPTGDTKEDIAPEPPAAEETQEAPAEAESTSPVEVRGLAVEESETAPAEEAVPAEAPMEETALAEQAPSEEPAQEVAGDADAPSTDETREISVEETSAPQDTPMAEEAPEVDDTAKEIPTEAPEAEDTPAADKGLVDEAPNEEPAQESAPAAEESPEVEASPSDEPVEEEKPADDTEPSAEKEDDDTPKNEEAQAADDAVDDGAQERAIPEISTKAVVDESTADDGPSTEPVENEEEHSKPSEETEETVEISAESQEVPEVSSKAVAEDEIVQDETPAHDEPAQPEVAAGQDDLPAQDDDPSPEEAEVTDAPAQDEAENDSGSKEDLSKEEVVSAHDKSAEVPAEVPTEEISVPETTPAEDDSLPTDEVTAESHAEEPTEDKPEPADDESPETEQAQQSTDDAVPEPEQVPTSDLAVETLEDQDKPDDAIEASTADQQPADDAAVEVEETRHLEDSQSGAVVADNADGKASDEAHASDEPPAPVDLAQEESQSKDEDHQDQAADNQIVEPSHPEANVEQQDTLGADDNVQAQDASQEVQAEVSDQPPTTQEEEEHLPTTASKDLEDADSQERDAMHSDGEEHTRGVLDADDSAHGPSDTAADASTVTEPAEVSETLEVDQTEALKETEDVAESHEPESAVGQEVQDTAEAEKASAAESEEPAQSSEPQVDDEHAESVSALHVDEDNAESPSAPAEDGKHNQGDAEVIERSASPEVGEVEEGKDSEDVVPPQEAESAADRDLEDTPAVENDEPSQPAEPEAAHVETVSDQPVVDKDDEPSSPRQEDSSVHVQNVAEEETKFPEISSADGDEELEEAKAAEDHSETQEPETIAAGPTPTVEDTSLPADYELAQDREADVESEKVDDLPSMDTAEAAPVSHAELDDAVEEAKALDNIREPHDTEEATPEVSAIDSDVPAQATEVVDREDVEAASAQLESHEPVQAPGSEVETKEVEHALSEAESDHEDKKEIIGAPVEEDKLAQADDLADADKDISSSPDDHEEAVTADDSVAPLTHHDSSDHPETAFEEAPMSRSLDSAPVEVSLATKAVHEDVPTVELHQHDVDAELEEAHSSEAVDQTEVGHDQDSSLAETSFPAEEPSHVEEHLQPREASAHIGHDEEHGADSPTAVVQDELVHKEEEAERDEGDKPVMVEDQEEAHRPGTPIVEDVHQPSFDEDKHDHDDGMARGLDAGAQVTRRSVELGEAEDDHPASFDDSQELGEKHDLSVITEHTEPAASTAGDTSGLAASYYHPDTLSRNVSEAPDVAAESSYMTETTSMAAAADRDHDQEYHGDFEPAGAHDHGDASFSSSTKQVHFDDHVDSVDYDDDHSSPVLSVREEDSDAEETYVNPFARPTQQAAYNPFAQQTATETSEASNNPFARNTTTAADFLRSVSPQGQRSTSPAAEHFLRSASSFGSHPDEQARESSITNPFARSTTPTGRSSSGSPLAQRSPGNPFARSTTPGSDFGHDADVTGHESTFEDPFAAAAPPVEGRQPTPQVPESYNPFARSPASDRSFLPTVSTLGASPVDTNPFAAARSRGRSGTVGSMGSMGSGADDTSFGQAVPSIVGQEYPVGPMIDSDEEGEDPFSLGSVGQSSSPLAARLAVTPLDTIQERYNSELEDMDSDSEEPESLTGSQQLPPLQQRVPPSLPSIQERHGHGFEDSDEEEEDYNSNMPGQINPALTSSQYRESPPPPPPRVPSSQGFYQQEAADSSEDDGHPLELHSAAFTQPAPLSSSLHRATPPPPPPPRGSSSQGHYGRQLDDSSEEEQNDWDNDFTPAQPTAISASQFGTAPPPPPPPRAPSSLSQSRLHVEDSDEEDQGVLPSQDSQPFAMASSGYRATPPPPPAPRAPSSQGFHHQEQADSSEDEIPNIARPGQFPISSTSQFRATPPPPPPPRAPVSQGLHGQDLLDTSDEEEDMDDAWESNATRPGQMHSLSTSQYRATPPPPPPPRAPSAQDRYRQPLEDSDSEEEDLNANQYGQTTDVTVTLNNQLMESDPMATNPMSPASPLEPSPMATTNLMRSTSPLATVSPMSASPAAQQSPTETQFTASGPRSSQDLPSHPREEDGEESDDSWENINQRGEAARLAADSAFPAPTPQLRVDNYEQQWANASNDQISTASTYLTPAGPGDFTDTDSQEYATPLASAGFSASSQYTQGALDSPRHPESADIKDSAYDPAYAQATSGVPHGQDNPASHLEDSDSDNDSDYITPGVAPAAPSFLTQFNAPQQPEPTEPVLEQVIDSFQSDEDDGPKTAVMASDEPVTQYASSRFGASSWRDELRSPSLFGASRHSRSDSLRSELQKSIHEGAETGQPSPLQTQAYQPEVHVQEVHSPEEAQMYGQAFGQDPYAAAAQQAQMYGQDPYAQQQFQQFGHVQDDEEQYGRPQYSPDYQQTQHGQLSSLEAELQEADDSSEDEFEHATPQLAPQQSEQAPDVSPLALRQESSPVTPSRATPATPVQGTPSTPSRGLANSRHNPDRPQTPPSQPVVEEDFDPDAFVPRDVTNVPWHARTDSVPYSVQSQSTIDSMASSPIHSALPVDKHEPVIRDSWPASVHNLTRPRNDSTLTDRSFDDPFKYDGGGTKSLHGASGSVGSTSDSPGRASGTGSSPGSLISRMRGIFEGNQAKQEPASPVRSRPVSGVFHPVRRAKPEDEDDGPGYQRKAGFLNEHEDEVDEQSALLRNSAGGLEAN
ncbi:hypothetical protein GCG54_00014078 [Colletotrichum gloeosporioides]|uniref:Uncharacterized protein n=1 Tax=Colletotrichum gloeosporioides TaxID=474922 RepID=A0A8H4CTP0_COLGL|nr:uncharacterized protein GCG54_00014078 [Colletotrichum gloeosporioides]KAF3809865.1 hypothetical protein GCG54_00014078 [Colletotrichum gloeosporioides]